MFKLYSEIKYIFPSTAGDKRQGQAPPPTARPEDSAPAVTWAWGLYVQSNREQGKHTHKRPRRRLGTRLAPRPGVQTTAQTTRDRSPPSPLTRDHRPAGMLG